MFLLSSVESQIGKYLSALVIVYLVIVLAHLLTNLLFSFGIRPPYAVWSEAVLNFLRDTSEPYLRVFRKFIPSFGPLDLSPMIAIFVLLFLNDAITHIFNG